MRPVPEDPARRDADAGALAAAFAADFLSWDESDPARRARALATYAAPGGDPATGWSGRGRQRADLALPGAVVRLGADRVLVHVRVRVTPFRRVAPSGPRPVRFALDVLPFPASAPAPAHPMWEGLDSYWYELLVPMRGSVDRWRVDVGAVIAVPPLPERGS
ncbi:hypothetical protein BJF78_06290 [Pseudonocardia sp. CNS-139]|nr:hypothetical protein BJF78_06290 [Pseudonocardia sp. CNS-139]